MKQYYKYSILWLFALAFLTTACEKDEPPFYDMNEHGVYFDYEKEADFKQEINFADHVLGDPQDVKITLKMKVLGYLTETSRKAVLKTKAVEEYPEASVVLPEVIFEANEYEKEIEITVNRPEERDTDYAISIYLDSEDANSQLGSGIAGKEEFVVYVKETYEKPTSVWGPGSMAQMYLGEWSVDKHIFLINLTQNNDYVQTLYDYYAVVGYNEQAVSALRAQRENNPDEPILIDIPFVTDVYNYEKPSYWGDLHQQYLGTYSNSLFVSLANAVGANTANETELLDGDEQTIKNLNKTAVKYMMNQYDTYMNSWGMACEHFKGMCWIPMFPDMDYDVVRPGCWSPYGVDGGETISQYYGTYSEEKYKFMIKTWLAKQGTENFVLVQMFPLMLNWSDWKYDWDNSIGGENQIKACYKAFKEAYDAAPAGTYSFTFPELTIE